MKRSSIALAMLLPATLLQAQAPRDEGVLEQDAYRTRIDEIVVVAQQPSWRREQPEEWRPEKFELPELINLQRFEWLPKYSKDERDQYQSVRDPRNEKPEIKLFEINF